MRRLRKLKPTSPMQEWMYMTTGFCLLILTWRFVVLGGRRPGWISDNEIWVMAFAGAVPFVLLFWWAGLWCLKVAERLANAGTDFRADDDER